MVDCGRFWSITKLDVAKLTEMFPAVSLTSASIRNLESVAKLNVLKKFVQLFVVTALNHAVSMLLSSIS
ncbi:MAG: hypothetical protein KCHDKBKB_02388 [Elusimicrobia bacterium]|nr:hypothetical protein [Elusimicrobiota bacterium]